MWRRVPLVRQNDRSDCGAAALATLALYHRRPAGLEKLRDLSGTDESGASLLGLARAATAIGFTAKAVHCPDLATLAQLPLPAVAHVHDQTGSGHFVVVFRIRRGKILVGDPASAVHWHGHDQFCKGWTNKLLLATPGSAPATKADKSASPFSKFLRLLRPHREVLVEVVICALLMALLAITTSYFVQHLVDSVLVRDERPLLNALGIGMVLVVLFKTAFSMIRQYLLAHVGRKIDLALIGGYARHVLRLPARFFENRRVGEIYSRVTDIAKLRDAINGAATTAVVDGIVVVVLLAVLWAYDARLAAASSLVIPLFFAAVAVHHPAVRKRSQETMEHGAQLSSHLIEDFSGIETFKAFHAEDDRLDQGERRLVSFAQSLFALQKLDMQLTSITAILTGIAGIGVLWYGGHRVMDGALSIGQLLFFYTLLSTMLDPLSRLSTVNLKIQDALVAVDRLYQILDIDQESFDDDKVAFVGVKKGLAFDRVEFGYGSRGNVLKGISLAAPAGKLVAIVGESGSGKSTLLKLLLSYYQPTQGRVLVDGVDLRDIEVGSYRQRLGVVSQDPFIFNGSMRQNIALAQPDASLDQVIEVARIAGLDEFINALPQRYETAIGERGANLSGGQRQRLAIARALLHDPDVLIFDEATSHLDTATEQVIQANLRDRLAGKTIVVVAHRLSTVKDADVIHVMHEGQIVEQGSHNQLLRRNGRYALLWKAQTGAAETIDCNCHLSSSPALSSVASFCREGI